MSTAAQDSLDTGDEEYTISQNEENIPVTKDKELDEPAQDAGEADSEKQRVKDDQDAIDKNNIISQRTRGAAPKEGYKEPGDTEGIPTDD